VRSRASPLLLGILAVACGEQPRPAGADESTSSYRDSAGIRIVSSNGIGEWRDDDERWIAERELTIGGAGDTASEFGHIADLDVGPDGRIHVLDDQSGRVVVFDAGGGHVRSFGRVGGGPGESRIDAFAIRVDRRGTIYVRDGIHRRDQVFDSAGAFVRTLPLAGPLREWEPLEDGGSIQRAKDGSWDGLVRVDADGAVVDTVLAFSYDIVGARGALAAGPERTGTDRVPIPLLPALPAWTLTTDGRIATGTTNRARIEVRRADGSIDGIVELAGGARPLTTDDRDRMIRRVEALMRDAGMSEPAITRVFERFEYLPPDTLPAFTRLMGGPDGSIWVQRPLSTDSMKATALLDALVPDGRDWDVFCGDGRYLGVLTLPSGFELRVVAGPLLYGLETDALDVRRIVRLRLRTADGREPSAAC
jgi:hypothetical protein